MNVYANGGWRTPSAARIFKDGAWRVVTRVQVYKSGAWKTGATFASSLTVSYTATPATVVFSTPTSGTGQSNLTATPSGGIAPYTYLHSVTEHLGAGPTPYLATPTLASCLLTAGALQGTEDDVAVRVTVTDAIGQIVHSDPIGVQFINIFGA